MRTADVKAGEDYFTKHCTVCHNIGKGAPNKVGPHLWGVMGRPIASISDFSYSDGMKKHAAEAKTWTFENMNKFQYHPQAEVPGTLMSYGGTPNDAMRANLIVYLNSQNDSPLPLPKPSAKAPAPTAGKPADNAPAGKVANVNNPAAPASARVSARHPAAIRPTPPSRPRHRRGQ